VLVQVIAFSLAFLATQGVGYFTDLVPPMMG